MKKLIAVLFCAGYFLTAQANSTIVIEFEKDSEKFNEATVHALSVYTDELYLAKGIKVTLQEPRKSAEAQKQALFYKREIKLIEFFKEEHLNFDHISFIYEVEGKKMLPVISVEIVSQNIVAEIIRPDSTFTNASNIAITCQFNDIELAQQLTVAKLVSQEELYNSNVSSFFDNKIIFIRELLNIKFPEVVYAQAVIESGNFTSKKFREDNNLFGMRKAKSRCTLAFGTGTYAKFKTWRESVIDYALYQTAFAKKCRTRAEYVNHLARNYATGSNYSGHLLQVIEEVEENF
jgi:hypothetical protein